MNAAGTDWEGLGVVVLAYGSGDSFAAVLDSLRAAGVAPEAIVLVHNPARAGEAPPSAPAGVEVRPTGRNLGYAGGMNVGIEVLRRRGASLLLLLTHDAALRPGGLARLVAAMRGAPEVGLAGPVLVLGDGETVYSYGGTTDRTGRNRHLKSPAPTAPDGIGRCDWVDGGTILVRAEVLAAVGVYDERFWGYCEEADLCLRVRRGGWAVGVVPDARAEQDPGATKRPGVWAYLMTRNGIEYARRARGAVGLAGALGRGSGSVAVSILRSVLRALGLREGAAGEPWALAVGTARGEIDFLRGRWGAPPRLPGSGDVGNQ